jgi:hypothetical protein
MKKQFIKKFRYCQFNIVIKNSQFIETRYHGYKVYRIGQQDEQNKTKTEGDFLPGRP